MSSWPISLFIPYMAPIHPTHGLCRPPGVLHCCNCLRKVVVVTLLISGLVLFFFIHLLREFGLRDRVIAASQSHSAYMGMFAVFAFLALLMIGFGKAQADFSMVWEPLFEWRFLSHILMIPAFILVVAGNVPNTHFRRYLRNPMMIGTCLWGISHLWANGDLASILLFGGFTAWAATKAISLTISQPAPTNDGSIIWDIIAVVIGLVLYGTVAVFHGQLFGVGLNFA